MSVERSSGRAAPRPGLPALLSLALLLTVGPGTPALRAAVAQPADRAASGAPATTVFLRGEVVDSSGAPIAGAEIAVAGAPYIPPARAGGDGRFELPLNGVPPDAAARTVTATAPGFARTTMTVQVPPTGPVRLVLEPAPFVEAVNVTSSRSESPRADPTVTVSVISAAELESRAAVTLDDTLKLVPGFTLFRRTSSRVSNPTAQGVTLRGLGGTGSSRSLVLADGLPLNDAFGGWVYWDKLPAAAIDRVEVLRGSGSDLYGADAVGGVVHILTRRPERLAAQALAEGGNQGTGRVSLFAGAHPGRWTVTGAGEWFTTDGYVLVARDQRGPVDTRAGSDHRSLLATAGHATDRGWRVETGVNVFSEDRRNGTPAVYNATASRRAWAEAAAPLRGATWGFVSARVFGGTQGYDQSFSAVNASRTTEDLNRLQRIPTTVIGTGVQWVHAIGGHALLVGGEMKFIEGRTQETRLAQGRVLGLTDDGGEQQTGSVFVQDTWTPHARLTLVAGVHADGWHTKANNSGYDKTLGAVNPRVSAAWVASPVLSLRGSVYGGFRAPTLNELYRGFRTGNTQVNPNEALKPERLTGADWGVVLSRGPWSARATAYWNRLDDVITNVTLSRTPTLITQQRQNGDRMRAAGVELEGSWRRGGFATTVTGTLVSSRFKGNTSVRDNRVPQVPGAQLGLDVRYGRAGWTGSAQFRITGEQFEDDLNLLPLRPAHVLDLLASRAVTRRVNAFVALENVFDAEYDVGRTPILTVGLPRTMRVGTRVTW